MTNNYIPYRKDLRAITGSVTATILWERLIYKFEKNKDGFWKFTQPCKHRLYKQSDSWTEELGFTYKEFRAAFAKIGIAYKSMQQLNAIENPFIKDDQEYAFISYQDRTKNLTHYRSNINLIKKILDKLKITKSKPAPRPAPKPKVTKKAESFKFNDFKWPSQLEQNAEIAKILSGLDHKEIVKVLAVFEQNVKTNGIKTTAIRLLAGLVNKQKNGELNLDKKTEFKLEDTSWQEGIKDCPYCDEDGFISLLLQNGRDVVDPKCGHPKTIKWSLVKRVKSARPGYQTPPNKEVQKKPSLEIENKDQMDPIEECPYCNSEGRMELQLEDDTYVSKLCSHKKIKRSWQEDGFYVKKILSAKNGYDEPPIIKGFQNPTEIFDRLKNLCRNTDDVPF